MTKVCVLDFETSISKTIHKALAKEPSNDFYTIIWGNSPDTVQVKHKENAERYRQLPPKCVEELYSSDFIVGHNLPFDLAYLIKSKEMQDYILRGGKFWDTQIAEYLMTGQRHSFSSLAELQDKHLGVKTKDSRISRLYAKGIGADVIIGARKRCPRLFQAYHNYSKDDGVSTLKVFSKQYAKAKAKGMLPIINMYNDYMIGLVLTMSNGIKVDMIKTEKTLNIFKLKVVELLKEASEIIKDYWTDERLPEFNILSPTHKSAVLFGGEIKCKVRRENGFTKAGVQKTKIFEEMVAVKGFGLPIEFTAKSKVDGRYVTDAAVIHRISEMSTNHDAKRYCELQKKAMNYEKMCSTYLEAFLKYSVKERLYPHFNNTATATGRLSSSAPNLQNVPSKGEIAQHIQGQLIAPEGYDCVSIDFSQLEIYVSALLSGDKNLTKDLLSGVDFHIKRLSYAENMSYDQVYKLCKIDKLPEWDLKRSKAKIISYQKAYGASPKKLAVTTGIDEEIINHIFRKEDEEYADVARFNQNVRDTAASNEYPALEKDLPSMMRRGGKNGRRFIAGYELLPIVLDNGDFGYKNDQYRKIAYYREMTGKFYAFEEYGRWDKRTFKLKRSYSYTQMMNYMVQGTAGDIVAAATAKLTKFILKNQENVQMVNQIHDSVWFYVKKSKKDLIIPQLVAIMENIPEIFKEYLGLEIPFAFKVDAEVGDNFIDMESYKNSV